MKFINYVVTYNIDVQNTCWKVKAAVAVGEDNGATVGVGIGHTVEGGTVGLSDVGSAVVGSKDDT